MTVVQFGAPALYRTAFGLRSKLQSTARVVYRHVIGASLSHEFGGYGNGREYHLLIVILLK